MDPGETLKKATALKRAGDLPGAIALLHVTIPDMPLGTRWRPTAYKKAIGYLIKAGRTDEALSDANAMIEEAPSEAAGQLEMIGTCFNAAYHERARALLASGRPVDAFLDHVRATWHWQHAMRLQGRTKSEHTPGGAAESLLESMDVCGLELPDGRIRELTLSGLQLANPEQMVEGFAQVLQAREL